ncbi:alpha/beta-hydrolase [Rhizoclosmatium globosum]|uniref:Alpha/beta-hydrolase n=1 Tax=Rhizoclosmatium globosum TaxID=329046 RepID=A0A1Y2CAB6_9FUNG|nr:alpha/beta-hydrolase [Rhizoclosmatium globosum]|eukprot:ORY43847.1 alpha/beta-hydrolase [Rhizoclosmatium globosum]
MPPSGTQAFKTFRGITLKALVWGKDHPSAHKVLAVHGWLDNAATWDVFLNSLFEQCPNQFYVAAIELAGHGQSEHRSMEADYLMYHYVEDVVSVADSLGWQSFSILGHSIGGGISLLAASILGPRVVSVTSIESLGVYSLPTHHAYSNAVAAIKGRSQLKNHVSKPRVFSSIEEAIDIRIKTGLHRISEDGTRKIVTRGLKKVEGGYSWSSDPICAKDLVIVYSEDDVYSFLNKIDCPVLNVYGDKGIRGWFHERGYGGREKQVKDLKIVSVPGGHHLHLEAETAQPTVNLFISFMKERVLNKAKL